MEFYYHKYIKFLKFIRVLLQVLSLIGNSASFCNFQCEILIGVHLEIQRIYIIIQNSKLVIGFQFCISLGIYVQEYAHVNLLIVFPNILRLASQWLEGVMQIIQIIQNNNLFINLVD